LFLILSALGLFFLKQPTRKDSCGSGGAFLSFVVAVIMELARSRAIVSRGVFRLKDNNIVQYSFLKFITSAHLF